MQAAAAAPAAAPPPAPRHRAYTAVNPRCEWARTDDADTLVVDVSGFRKEELKVLYNTSRKLKVTGERPIAGGGSGRWARFLKSFPVARSVNSGAIRAVMDKEQALLFVILPKGSGTQKEQQPGNHVSLPKDGGGTGNADGSSGSGSFWSAQEDVEKNRIEEKRMVPEETKGKTQAEEVVATQDVGKTQGEEVVATQDVPITYGSAVANAIDNDGDDGQTCKNKKWWQKIKPLHVVGFAVLILALVGVGALYVILLL